MPYPIFALTPGIIVENSDFDNSPANTPVVLLSYSSTIGDKIVIRDVSGRASGATPIIVSTVGGVSFVRNTSTVAISSFKISEAFGRGAVSATSPFFYTVLDAADFPHRPAPYAIKPWYENISTVSTYTATVISTFTETALGPLESVAFTTATGSAAFTSTNADAISTNTLYSASNYTSSIYAAALSTNVLNVGSFTAASIDGGYMRLEGHMATTGNTYVAGNYSTIAGNLLNTYDFSAQSNVTVGDAFSTLGSFYATGPITSRGTFTIGGQVSAATLVAVEGAAHASTVYVGGSFKGANYVGVGAAQTSSIAVGTAALPSYSADIGGSLFSKDMFITAASASTTTISTAVIGLSTIRISNGLGAFNNIYADAGTLYYNGVQVGTIGTGKGVYGTATAVDRLYVSSFTSTATTYASTLLAGSNSFITTSPSVEMQVDGGIRASLISTPSRAVTHIAVGLAGAGAASINSIKYSIDNGLTFNNIVTGGFTGANTWGFGVAYNGSLWIAGGEGSGVTTLKYSSDGSNFNNIATGGFSIQCNTLKWNGRMWVAVGQSANANSTIQYSYNGSNWTGVTNGFVGGAGAGCFAAAWNGRLWAAIGSNNATTSIKYSYDGITWTNATNGFFVGPRLIATNGRTFIATGSNASATQWAAISSNAINWTYVNVGYTTGLGIRNVLWDGNMWITTTQFATGTQNGSMRCSFDGINWFPITGQTNYKGGFAPMIYDGSRYFLPGQAGSTTTYSYNLINWSNCVNSEFATNSAYNMAFRENFDPIMKVNNLDVRTAQGYPQYNNIASTNTIFSRFSGFNAALTHSTSLILNNTLGINPPSGTSINGCISSLSYALFVYGSTFTNDPNPVKLGGGNWTTVSDSNLKNEYPINRDVLYSNIVTSFENVKLKEFNFKKTMVPVYVNPMAIERRNMKIQVGKNNTLRLFTNIEPYTGSNFDEINTETQMMRQNGFISQEVAQYVPNATVNFPMGGSNYLGIDTDQLNMIHLATTQHLMSTIECQHSTLKGQEDQMATIFENFEILRAIGNNI